MTETQSISFDEYFGSRKQLPDITHHLPDNMEVLPHPLMKPNITLCTHQRIDISAMCKIENNIGKKWDVVPCRPAYVGSGVLSEPFGSGKTLIILGLIATNCMPLPSKKVSLTISKELTIDITYRKVLHPTLIFVGSNVLGQWKNEIIEKTHLKVMKISTVNDVRKLEDMVYGRSETNINSFDIILVKNGKISVDYDIPGYINPKNTVHKKMFIWNIIANFTLNAQYAWKRVIIDDIDTIGIPSHFIRMHTLFTWIVSGSQNLIPMDSMKPVPLYKVSRDALEHFDMFVDKQFADLRIARESLDIHCRREFTSSMVDTGKPSFYLYVFENPHEDVIEMIGSISADIMEMLNGDAIETAAKEVGSHSSNVNDVFQKILGDQFNEWKTEKAHITYIKTTKSNYPSLPEPPRDKNNRQMEQFNEADFNKMKIVKFKFSSVPPLIEKYLPIHTKKHEEASIKIQRVKDNISAMDCPICFEDLDMETTFIHKCCGNITCKVCSIEASKFMANEKKTDYFGKCSKCSAKLSFKNDIIVLDKNFDLSKINEDVLDYDADADRLAREAEEAAALEEEPKNEPLSKIDVLMQIINQDIKYKRSTIQMDVQNLLIGSKDLPEAKPDERAFVVCTSYEEIINKILNQCKAEGIPAAHLQGSAEHMDMTITEFREKRIKLLIINQKKHAGGLNLQFATDLIFIQKMANPELEKQVMGRLQRYGRTTKANIHILVYQKEISTYSIKLTPS